MRRIVFALAVLLVTPAVAQRAAVSADLSPETAGEIFRGAVVETCVPAVTGNGVSGLSATQRGQLQLTNDAETRQQAGAAVDETVWDVVIGKGVVTVHDKPGRCVVSVYGPPAAPTIMALASELSGDAQGFERLAAAASPTGLGAALFKVEGAQRLQVMISGSEPGMPGHRSRFSVVTATVFSTPAS